MESAAGMYNQLEDWYDEHPDATLGEIETSARGYRLKLVGETIALMINGQSEGHQGPMSENKVVYRVVDV